MLRVKLPPNTDMMGSLLPASMWHENPHLLHKLIERQAVLASCWICCSLSYSMMKYGMIGNQFMASCLAIRAETKPGPHWLRSLRPLPAQHGTLLCQGLLEGIRGPLEFRVHTPGLLFWHSHPNVALGCTKTVRVVLYILQKRGKTSNPNRYRPDTITSSSYKTIYL